MAHSPDVLAPPDEARLLRLAQAGDQAAFEHLLRTHHEAVFRLVVGILRHEQDARDVCQDVWVTAWQQMNRFRGDARFSTWMHAIAVRRAIDHLRRRRRGWERFVPAGGGSDGCPQTDAPLPEACEPGPDAREALEQHERRERLDRILAALPPMHRTVLALREVQGLSYEEMAAVLQCRPGTVMSRLFHARRLLARKLQESSCD